MDVRILLEPARLLGIDSRLDRRHAPLDRVASRVHARDGLVMPVRASRRPVFRSSGLPVVFLFLFFLGCRGPQQPYTSFGAGAAELKQQFNADAGKTRIVILPAPN
jgi:hypothetical protein